MGFNLTNTATATLITVDSDKLLKINRITCANVDGTNSATVDLFVDGLGSGTSGVTTTGVMYSLLSKNYKHSRRYIIGIIGYTYLSNGRRCTKRRCKCK